VGGKEEESEDDARTGTWNEEEARATEAAKSSG
jgi:hypothetical protein